MHSYSRQTQRHRALSYLSLLLILILQGCAAPGKPEQRPMVVGKIEAPSTLHDQLGGPITPSAGNLQNQNSQELLTNLPTSIGTAATFTDADIQRVFMASRQLVEHYTGADLSSVHLQLASNSTIQDEVRHETRKLIVSQFSNPVYAEKFLQRMVDDQASSYAALYTDRGNRVMVSRPLLRTFMVMTERRNKPLAPAVAALLIHELVHAADDVRYDIHKNRVMNFKISFTQSAAFEGHAQMVTRRICTTHGCLSGMEALEKFMFAPIETTDPVAQSVQAISRNVLEYSYIEGERFLTALRQRPNGEQLIDQVLRQPPQDPIQVLVPETYPDTSRQQRNAKLRDAMHLIQHPWASPPWKIIETSPIKGINVRNHPERRSAAVEGFTRLIVAMESAQIYNQTDPALAPVDLTLLEADSADTARMFADSFIQHASADGNNQPIVKPIYAINASKPAGELLIFAITPQDIEQPQRRVLVAKFGRYVLQLSGPSFGTQIQWMEFTHQVLERTLDKPLQDIVGS